MFSPTSNSRSVAAAANHNGGFYHHSETQNEEQLYLMEHAMDLAEGDYNNEGIVSNDASRLAMRSFEWKNDLMES